MKNEAFPLISDCTINLSTEFASEMRLLIKNIGNQDNVHALKIARRRISNCFQKEKVKSDTEPANFKKQR